MFALLSSVFEEKNAPLGDAYIHSLLSRADFWAIAAFDGEDVVGGITGHTLPMTSTEDSELFVYDLAVKREYQRQGIGRELVSELRALGAAAGVSVVFVPADSEDTHAIDFYRRIGGAESSVKFFTFGE
jgi:aminoglycoside 3-N-acetyltransferase I